MTDSVVAQEFDELLGKFCHTRDDYNIKIAEHQAIIREHRRVIASLKKQRESVVDLWKATLAIMRRLGYR